MRTIRSSSSTVSCGAPNSPRPKCWPSPSPATCQDSAFHCWRHLSQRRGVGLGNGRRDQTQRRDPGLRATRLTQPPRIAGRARLRRSWGVLSDPLTGFGGACRTSEPWARVVDARPVAARRPCLGGRQGGPRGGLRTSQDPAPDRSPRLLSPVSCSGRQPPGPQRPSRELRESGMRSMPARN